LSDAALVKLIDSKPLVELGDSIILLALKERASDIHIEPKRNEVVVRFRIDGDLVDRLFLPKGNALPLTSRYKISSGLDITERRKPQDGRLSFVLPMKRWICASPACRHARRKSVMRILGSLIYQRHPESGQAGFLSRGVAPFKTTLKYQQGILFVTGRPVQARAPRCMRR